MFSRNRLALTLLAATSSKCLASTCVATSHSLISHWNATRRFSTASPADAAEHPEFIHAETGVKEDRRIFFYRFGSEQTEENKISPWHDIPLFRDVRHLFVT